ncbi:helix-turn-helix domain-containing protein [Ciceribacter ferrooxidans]|uniref:Transcriptional regulator n=1 Tax=Ciceribacter ferrooxidans TaxID=2509717 RepID=A0A4Q2T5L0_9HYPH|nr:helix-turn-helix domain-containing protein [Ciceribacter ferrooxidans]RYC13932.1 transcriptional regulator [Ciceribacter ferrooxidans]
MIRSAEDFGKLVKLARKGLGWTQRELAARSGTGERFIVDLEGGKPSCQLDRALLVARTVGLELGDLREARSIAPQTGTDDDLAFLPSFGSDT